jgi:hypothetical protein
VDNKEKKQTVHLNPAEHVFMIDFTRLAASTALSAEFAHSSVFIAFSQSTNWTDGQLASVCELCNIFWTYHESGLRGNNNQNWVNELSSLIFRCGLGRNGTMPMGKVRLSWI